MPTKRFADCPACGLDSLPTDHPRPIEFKYGTYHVAFWRYDCPRCGWIWADAAQRAHNAQVERAARKRAIERVHAGG